MKLEKCALCERFSESLGGGVRSCSNPKCVLFGSAWITKNWNRLQCAIRAAKRPGRVPGKCRWVEDNDGNWATGCGELWCFEDGGPKDNGVRYCYKCGRRVEVREVKGG